MGLVPYSQNGISLQSFTDTISLVQLSTLDSGINIGVRLLIFGLFPGATFLIREGNSYSFSTYPLFDVIGDAYL